MSSRNADQQRVDFQASQTGAKVAQGENSEHPMSPAQEWDRTGFKERSVSRGREGYYSCGRGGVGNIRATTSAIPRVESSSPFGDGGVRPPQSEVRGREPTPRVYSTGRGGAGNLFKPPAQSHEVPITSVPYSAPSLPGDPPILGVDPGKSRSRSQQRAMGQGIYSTGRGGAGNMFAGKSGPAPVHVLPTQPLAAYSSHTGAAYNYPVYQRNGRQSTLSDASTIPPPAYLESMGGRSSFG